MTFFWTPLAELYNISKVFVFLFLFLFLFLFFARKFFAMAEQGDRSVGHVGESLDVVTPVGGHFRLPEV